MSPHGRYSESSFVLRTLYLTHAPPGLDIAGTEKNPDRHSRPGRYYGVVLARWPAYARLRRSRFRQDAPRNHLSRQGSARLQRTWRPHELRGERRRTGAGRRIAGLRHQSSSLRKGLSWTTCTSSAAESTRLRIRSGGPVRAARHAVDPVGAKRVCSIPSSRCLPAWGMKRSCARSSAGYSAGYASKSTVMITGEKGETTLTRHGFEEYVTDAVIQLDHRVYDQISTRRLRVVKYRGSITGPTNIRSSSTRMAWASCPSRLMTLQDEPRRSGSPAASSARRDARRSRGTTAAARSSSPERPARGRPP